MPSASYFLPLKISFLFNQNRGQPTGFQALIGEPDHITYILNTYELTVCLLGAIPQTIVRLMPKLGRVNPELNSIKVDIHPGLA